MASLLTNVSAMNALASLRTANRSLETTQGRISSGLKVASGKDNAAYFSISQTMKGDSGMYAAVREGLTLTGTAYKTARMASEVLGNLADQFVDKVAFAQGAKGGEQAIGDELREIVRQMKTTVLQSTFNGDDLLNAEDIDPGNPQFVWSSGNIGPVPEILSGERLVVTGVTRNGGTFDVTTMPAPELDMAGIVLAFDMMAFGFASGAKGANPQLDVDGNQVYAGNGDPMSYSSQTYLTNSLKAVTGLAAAINRGSTLLGIAERSIETQQGFLDQLVDQLDTGISAMIDADMEEEAARLQAVQVQQQLATQALSIANSAPQGLISLFR